jgi:rubredoxin
MDTEYWYRCNRCGYMYTPQQVQALIQLHVSRSGAAETDPSALPSRIPCRKRGCDGSVLRTTSIFREGR